MATSPKKDSYFNKLVSSMCEEAQTAQDSDTVFYYDVARGMVARVASGEVLAQPPCVAFYEWFVCLSYVSHDLRHLSASGITCLQEQEQWGD